jgi:hypothetical protein
MSREAAQNRSSSGVGIPVPLGKTPRATPLSPLLLAVLQLRYGVVDVRDGDEPHGHESTGCGGAILLYQELIVGMDHGCIGLVVLDAPPEEEIAGRGEHDLAVHSVHVLLFEPPLRGAGALSGVIADAGETRILMAGRRDGQPQDVQVAVLHHDAVAAVGQLDAPGRPVPMLRRDAVRPAVRGYLQVRVR